MTQDAPGLIRSILDTDLYKLTMQQAVYCKFPNAQVQYRFSNRSLGMKFNEPCIDAIISAINEFVSLQDDECEWLKRTCPYFSPEYLNWLRNFRLNPREQAVVTFVPSAERPGYGDLEIEFHGLWKETMLYETPLLAIISEAYFVHMDSDWTMDGQQDIAYQKGKRLFETGVPLMEFGTRRRRSYATQELVIKGLVDAHEKHSQQEGTGKLLGTSNVHFAHKYNLTPLGTIAHEWSMGVGALHDYDEPNLKALKLWEEVYPAATCQGQLVALTDTFSSMEFFKELTTQQDLAKRWRGLRQDSGNPLTFIAQAKAAYETLDIDHRQKLIVFSDSLDVDACIKIKKASDEAGFISSFGVGTSLTNDFKFMSSGEKSKATNIVIKLSKIDGRPCIKISDDLMKNTGDKAMVKTVKEKFGLPV